MATTINYTYNLYLEQSLLIELYEVESQAESIG